MVKDLNTAPQSSSPQTFVEANGTMFFFASDPVHGQELWKTDGTAAGTSLVKDIYPGWRGSVQPIDEGQMAAIGGDVYFMAIDPTNFRQLWKSDGTAAGTVPILGMPAVPNGFFLASLDGALYFQALDTSNIEELWKSDGTPAGTVQLTTTGFSLPFSHPFPTFKDLGGTVYFLNDVPGGAEGLWKTDGTAAGTTVLSTFSGGAAELTTSGGSLYFVANDGGGTELWKSDGTADGTSLVTTIGPLIFGFSANDLTDFNGTLFFVANDGVHNSQVWKSDGTAGGTGILKIINAGGPVDLTVVGDRLFFAEGAPSSSGSPSLWVTDGTEAGTIDLKDIAGTNSLGSLTASGSNLFFIDDAGLWSSDGTAAGTVMLHAFTDVFAAPGPFQHVLPPEPGIFAGLSNLTAFGGGILFAGPDPATGLELWHSDGTSAGTTLLKDINTGTLDTNFFGLAPYGNKLIFQVQTPDDPADRDPTDAGTYALWVSNGKDSGTTELVDFGEDAVVDMTDTAVVNGTFFFATGGALWETDGTAAGTQVVLVPDPSGLSSVYSLTAVGNQLFFVASDGTDGYQLWRSDGTAAGTFMVKDINPSGDALPANLTAVGSTLYFSADDGVNGPQLWKSDGTAAGTTLVAVVNPGGTNLHDFAAAGGKLYFGADDGVHGDQLWKSNGTAAGTKMVADINPTGDAAPADLMNVGGTLYFTADDGVNGRQLWRSNGTVAGTTLVTVINAGNDANIHDLTVVHGTLFFMATDAAVQNEVWTSDGTAAGTVQLTPDTLSLQDIGMAGAGGSVFFTGYTANVGFQLWASDGTAAGTLPVQVLTPAFNPVVGGGFPTVAPADLTAAGSVVYFDADDLVHGRELWKATAPKANLTGPSTGTAGQELTFTLKASEPTFSNSSVVYTFTVNWGDGNTDTFTGPSGTTVMHAFAAAGNYTVSLRVTDSDGISSLPDTEAVSITPAPGPAVRSSAVATSLVAASSTGLTANEEALRTFVPLDWLETMLRSRGDEGIVLD
jgi:ELWxxDGT repeat protein